MNKHLYNTLFFTRYWFNKPGLITDIKTAWKNQYLLKTELINLQEVKLKKLLHHAYEFSPFYKEKFDHVGFHPNRFNNLSDIEMIPFLTKQEIRDHLETITVSGLPTSRREKVNTGGTTGIPMRFYRDTAVKDLMTALYLRTTRMYGCSVGSKTAWIWGLRKEDEYLDFRSNNFKSRFLKNTVWFNGFDMHTQSMNEFSLFSFRYKPELIVSYVSSLFEYAQFMKQNQIQFHPPKAIWLTAEPVEEMQRKLIEEVFQCPTFSQYGSSEILHIATECSAHKGLHLHADSRYVEITDRTGKGLKADEPGYIVVTDLENFAMPLIRYKNDDMSSFLIDECKCGSNLPKLNPIMGRVYNVFKLRSGKQIYGHMFSKKLFDYVYEIQKFQVHQTSYETINVSIVPGIILNKELLINELLSYFKSYTGDEVNYNFRFVDDISREKSGKLLYTKSDIK
jgi:phenylacetate-CoA ligase